MIGGIDTSNDIDDSSGDGSDDSKQLIPEIMMVGS